VLCAAEHPVLRLFHTGSRLHMGFIQALNTLLHSPPCRASDSPAPPLAMAAEALLSTPALTCPPPSNAHSRFTQVTQLSQLRYTQGPPTCNAEHSSTNTTQPRFASNPSEMDLVPTAVADTAPYLSVPVVQTVQLLTASLAGIKCLKWMELNCTHELFASLVNACREQVEAIHNSHATHSQRCTLDSGRAHLEPTSMRSAASSTALSVAAYGVVHSRTLACLAAVAIVEPQTVNEALDVILGRLVPGDDMEDAVISAAPETLPFSWIVALSKTVIVGAQHAGSTEAWAKALQVRLLGKIGIENHLVSNVLVCPPTCGA
jgi:hypothetical protein